MPPKLECFVTKKSPSVNFLFELLMICNCSSNGGKWKSVVAFTNLYLSSIIYSYIYNIISMYNMISMYNIISTTS